MPPINLKKEVGKQRKAIEASKASKPRKKRGPSLNKIKEQGMAKMLEDVQKLARKGLFNYQIGHSLGLDASKFSNLVRDKPELLTAIDRGRADAVAEVANVVYELAVYEREFKACEFFLQTVGGFKKIADPFVNINISPSKDDQIKEINELMTDDEATQTYMELCKEINPAPAN